MNAHNVSTNVTCHCLRWLAHKPTVDDDEHFITICLVNWPSSSSWKILWASTVTCLRFTLVSYSLHSLDVRVVPAEISRCLSSRRAVIAVSSSQLMPLSSSTSCKDQCEIIQHPISRKIIKILTTHWGKHNEFTVSLRKTEVFTHYHALGQAFTLSFRVEVHSHVSFHR